MILEKFKKDMFGKELTKQEGTFSLLMYGAVLPGCFPPYSNKYYDFDFKSFIFAVKEKHGTIFFNLENYRQVTTTTYRKLLKVKDKKSLPEYTDFIEIWNDVNDLYSQTKPNILAELNNKNLYPMVNKAFHLIALLLASTVFSESLDEGLVRRYYDEIVDHKQEFTEFFSIGSKATFESFVVRTDKVLLNFRTTHDLSEIQWVFTDYYTAPLIQTLATSIQELINNRGGNQKVEEELKKAIFESQRNQKEVENFRSKCSKEEQVLLDYIQLCMNVRDTRKEPLQKILTSIANVVREIFRRIDIPAEDAVYSYSSDFTSRLYEKSEYKQEINKRKKEGFVGYFNSDGCEFEYGDIESIKNDLYTIMDGGSSKGEIKGSIGCRGFAKASVSVISNLSDFSKFKAGNVLVTSMTRPEFVPLMKKASAVITDEGGITCHAAIVSRELNIPCIIGTKNATRILKDGDLVEVDADKGTITIIK